MIYFPTNGERERYVVMVVLWTGSGLILDKKNCTGWINANSSFIRMLDFS